MCEWLVLFTLREVRLVSGRFPVVGQTVSLPIAFGVICFIFWFYNIDFLLLWDVISLVFLCFALFKLFFFRGTRCGTFGRRFELFGFICFKRLLLLVVFIFGIGWCEGKVGLNTSHYTV